MSTIEPIDAIEKINYFFEKFEFDNKDKYFILKKMKEDVWDEIKNDNDDSEEEEDNWEDDFTPPDDEDYSDDDEIDNLKGESYDELDDDIENQNQTKVKISKERQQQINKEIEEAENELGNVADIEQKKSKIKADANFLSQPMIPRQKKFNQTKV